METRRAACSVVGLQEPLVAVAMVTGERVAMVTGERVAIVIGESMTRSTTSDWGLSSRRRLLAVKVNISWPRHYKNANKELIK